ncbi:peptidylprolyl isomerase [Candidatus Bathyarchaeota archaeon]|nr:peptidylprolyl isomerase [Candidatus Bathyarchaeota archaeon]
MPIKKGDFVLINYTGSIKETNEIFDTTIEEVSKNERMYKDGEIYEAKLIVVGEGWILKALDESIPNFKLEKTASVEIPPDQAFGNRDPEKVKMVPLRRLTARGVTPRVGMRIEYDGKTAIVRTLGAGRVQLDFNPVLAGKTLVYQVTIQKKLNTRNQKIEALIHRRVPTVEIEKFDLKIGKTVATISVPEEAFYIEGLQLAKRGIALDIQKFFPKITNVKFIEEIKKREAGEEQP